MPFIVLIYAVFVLIGGIIGHVKAASLASLIFGLIFGLLLVGSAIAMFAKHKFGAYGALALTFMLDAFFTYRFLKTHTFLPAGMLSLISFAVLIYLAISISKRPYS